MTIDLKQFYQVFFEESYEGLDAMEQGLLEINKSGTDDPELVNTIFRAAHSIKGGAGTLGFPEIVNFTHVLETLLDEVREGSRTLSNEAIDLLLKSCDALRDMFQCLEQEQSIDDADSKELLIAFEKILSETDAADSEKQVDENEADCISSQDVAVEKTFFPGEVGDSSSANDEKDGSNDAAKIWLIKFKPEPQILLTGNEPLRIFRELEELGDLEVHANTDLVPAFDQLSVDECLLSWNLRLKAEVDKDDIESAFDWVLDECELTIELVEEEPNSDGVADEALVQADESVEEIKAEAIVEADTSEPAVEVKAVETAPDAKPSVPVKAKGASQKSETSGVQSATSGSIRVGIDKVDNLINLVGELVITQSMLSELGNNFSMEKLERLASGLEQLQQNTRELQESVMRIRMLPISFTFNRFPRMIRDLSMKTGKKVELILSGEQTELDKTVMEQIGDPLVHLVRNAIDHGVEGPEDRIASGKNETGKIRMVLT